MDTLSFAFGVVAVLAVILIAVVAVGMVKVIKMQGNIDNLYTVIDQLDNRVHQRMSNDYNSLERIISDDRKELNLQLNLRVDSLNSYVDSRFDKMENKFAIGNSAKKQLND